MIRKMMAMGIAAAATVVAGASAQAAPLAKAPVITDTSDVQLVQRYGRRFRCVAVGRRFGGRGGRVRGVRGVARARSPRRACRRAMRRCRRDLNRRQARGRNPIAACVSRGARRIAGRGRGRFRCVAVGRRRGGDGRRIRSVRGVATGRSRRQACRRAMRECRRDLRRRQRTGRNPYGACVRAGSERIGRR